MTRKELINQLIKNGYLKNQKVKEAFLKIDRKDFVPKEYQKKAYENYPLPIGFGQTISQPLTVALMLELLNPKPGEKILEIGAGSGWKTALLAFLASGKKPGQVISLEIIPELEKMAKENVGKYNFIKEEIVKIILADGSKGFSKEAPYDKIISAASAWEKIPDVWKSELKVGGRLVAPQGESIIVLDKLGKNKFKEEKIFGFSFVPLVES